MSLHAGTEANFIPLTFSELVNKAVHLYGPPLSSNSQYNTQYRIFPCLNFTCPGSIKKLLFIAQTDVTRLGLPKFHLLRKYRGPEYCNDINSGTDCDYYQWLTLNHDVQYLSSILDYTKINNRFRVYETKLLVNNSFESGDMLGVYYPSPNYTKEVLYQREGGYCNTLGEITIHLFGGQHQFPYPSQDPALPYIAIETGQYNTRAATEVAAKCTAMYSWMNILQMHLVNIVQKDS